MVYVVPVGGEFEYARFKNVEKVCIKLNSYPYVDIVCSDYDKSVVNRNLITFVDKEMFIKDMQLYFNMDIGVRDFSYLLQYCDIYKIIKFFYNKKCNTGTSTVKLDPFFKSIISGEKKLIMHRYEELLSKYTISFIYNKVLHFISSSYDFKSKYGDNAINRFLLYLGTGVEHTEYRLLYFLFCLL